MPVYAVTSTSSPKAMRYAAKAPKSCVLMKRKSQRTHASADAKATSVPTPNQPTSARDNSSRWLKQVVGTGSEQGRYGQEE